MLFRSLHCCCYICLECHISAPGHTIGNCMGPPHSLSCNTSPTGWTSSSEEPSSPPPQYHPYHTLRGHPQGIYHKKSQGPSVRDASLSRTYSFLPTSWVGDTHEETNFLPISDREEKEGRCLNRRTDSLESMRVLMAKYLRGFRGKETGLLAMDNEN